MDRLPENAALRRLVAKLYGTRLDARDQCLLDFRYAKAPTQAMLDHCLEQCGIEGMGGNKCILLAYARREHPEFVFSDYAGPRIDGLIRYFHFANTKTLAHFSKIGNALNQAGIPILLFKGAAMRALRPELPRPMGDADILIPAERIGEATRIGEGLGYLHTREESNHAVDFHTEAESAVDVHHSIFDPDRDYTAFHKGLFERAKPATVFGVEVVLPSREDLCFLVMANLTRNLREHTTLHSISFTIPCGARVGIIGQSGAGKSTLTAILSGLVAPSSGAFLVDGRSAPRAAPPTASASAMCRRAPISSREALRKTWPSASGASPGTRSASSAPAIWPRGTWPLSAASTAASAKAAQACPAGRCSAWPSRAPSMPSRRCSSSTRPPAPSTAAWKPAS